MLIADVVVPDGRRALRDLDRLVESIREIGLLNPITVTTEGRLIAGYHRLEACRQLGWDRIPALHVPLDALDAELAEIDENLIRNELTVLERGEQLLRRKEIYEAKHPAAKHGGDRKSAQRNQDETVSSCSSFADDTADKTGVSPRSVQHEVQIAAALPSGVKAAIGDTPLADSKRELLTLSRVKDPEQQLEIARRVVEGKAKDVHSAIKELRKEQRIAEIEEQAARVPSDPSAGLAGPYNVIVIDPPWPYSTDYDPEGQRAACPYPLMSLEEIAAIELPAAEHCVLWLWTTHQFMRHAFPLLDHWGFEEKAILTWAKDRMGLGRWLRSQSEFCILAVRGQPPVRLTNQTTVLHGPMREHSRKPDEFYALVDELCVGKKLDWFSRERREGWDQVGTDPEQFSE